MNFNYLIIILISLIIGFGSIFLLGNDNPIEEIAEKVIEKETGIDIDLTPASPEK
jgi:hypothetical protein